MKCWKTSVFFNVSSSEGICTAWANSKWRKRYSVQAKRLFFYHAETKSLETPGWSKKSHAQTASSIWEVLPKWNFWWKYFASTGSFAPTSNDVRWFLHGICLFGQKRLASICSSFFGMCKRNNIIYQRNIKLMLAHVNNMCKRSTIFYERNIKLVFPHLTACARVAI